MQSTSENKTKKLLLQKAENLQPIVTLIGPASFSQLNGLEGY